jgi:dihydropteroate synthase
MAVSPRSHFRWALRALSLSLGERTLLVGVVNVTPDSFSDGGKFLSATSAVDHALSLLDEGADVLDIGGESTRPGTRPPVSTREELDRVLPVIQGNGDQRQSFPSTPTRPIPRERRCAQARRL